jgi:hydroxyethylthiazole kinase-like uncharacterized protein yjeF
MKIFETNDIREIDAFTITHEPVSSSDLMERAASGCATWIAGNLLQNNSMIIFAGPGNNGGDGWAIARLLADKGFDNIMLYHLRISEIISPDSELNRERLIGQGKVKIAYIRNADDFPELLASEVIIDALFGSGLTRKLDGLSAGLVRHMNASGCRIISIDIPSGLCGDDNTDYPEDRIIHANETLTFQFPKRSFFFAENEKYTGKWHIIPIGLHQQILNEKQTCFYFTTTDSLVGKIKKRKAFNHKGTYGHALLIAGSYGMMGATILGARACMRTGTGLLTAHVPEKIYPLIQISVPEAIFSIDPDEFHFTSLPPLDKFSAIAVGPGIGETSETVLALKSLLQQYKKPIVIDADALNILSRNREMIDLLPENALLTPHPLEFDRLAGTSPDGYRRNQRQIEFSRKHKVFIILKGAYSSITFPDGRCYYNSTGNPGMATAGSGDVLTGMILSLLAQGYPPDEAAYIAPFIHGMAGDLAADEKGQQAMIASDIIEHIGNAFNNILQYEKAVLL